MPNTLLSHRAVQLAKVLEFRIRYYNEALLVARTLMQEDVAFCEILCAGNPSGQTERRCFIRAEFAFIEAWLYALRYQGVLGNTDKIPTKCPTKENVEQTFEILSKALESSHVIDKQSKGWCAMLQAYLIRDRITHPKSMKDITITDAEMDVFGRAVQWFAMTAHAIEDKMRCDGRNL